MSAAQSSNNRFIIGSALDRGCIPSPTNPDIGELLYSDGENESSFNHNSVTLDNQCEVNRVNDINKDSRSGSWYHIPLHDRLQHNHMIQGQRSQMNLNGWSHELSFETDLQLKDYLWNGVKDGFHIIDCDVDVPSYKCFNYSSALQGEAYKAIDKLILKEIEEGKYILSETKPHNVHAMGAVPKADLSYRPITDCKRPLFSSVNNYMNTTHQAFSFSTVDDVSDMIVPQCYMATVDISSAYRSITINPKDWDRQGISWVVNDEKRYYKDTRLCFGAKCAPFIFTQISRFITNCMVRRGFPNIIGYIDDFWISENSYERCVAAQNSLLGLLGDLGFAASWHKCTSPCQSIRYLGIIFDSINMTMSLPSDKMQKLRSELEFFVKRKRATKHQLQRLCGVLSHAAKVVYGGRIFSRRMIDLLKGLPDKNVRIKLSDDFKEDLQWWRTYAANFNGHATIVSHHYTQEVVLQTDASKGGYGIVVDNDWMAGYINCDLIPQGMEELKQEHGHWYNYELQTSFNINEMELLPIWLAVHRYSHMWRNKLITCQVDNTQVMWAINRGRSVNKNNMVVLRKIFWESVKNNFHMVAIHVKGDENILPDLLSRLRCVNDLSILHDSSLCCVGSNKL